jgi:hypothetical protein
MSLSSEAGAAAGLPAVAQQVERLREGGGVAFDEVGADQAHGAAAGATHDDGGGAQHDRREVPLLTPQLGLERGHHLTKANQHEWSCVRDGW